MKKNSRKFSFLALLLVAAMLVAGVQLAAAAEGEDGEISDGDSDPGGGYYCDPSSEEMHPFGEGLADRYGVEYEILQEWFCNGFGWGQIMLALETSDIISTDEDFEDLEGFEALLARRNGGEGWGEIWQDLGLIGRPEDASPPEGDEEDEFEDIRPTGEEDERGRPEDAGPPEWAGQGRSEEVGPSDEDGERGRPEDAGPPEWASQGRPEHAGPPDKDGERGRPEDAGE
jgi:hypothetical protein